MNTEEKVVADFIEFAKIIVDLRIENEELKKENQTLKEHNDFLKNLLY